MNQNTDNIIYDIELSISPLRGQPEINCIKYSYIKMRKTYDGIKTAFNNYQTNEKPNQDRIINKFLSVDAILSSVDQFTFNLDS